jgi:hypothetical protein
MRPSRPPIPANLATPCPYLEAVLVADWDVLAQAFIKLAGAYGECATRYDGVLEAWRVTTESTP